MDRLKVLEAKYKELGGYGFLTGEEKAEYQNLKAEQNLPKAGEKKLSITKSELDGLIKSAIESFATGEEQGRPEDNIGKWSTFEPTVEKTKTASLKTYREDAKSPFGVIVKADYFKTVFNEETRKKDLIIYNIEVLYPDNSVKEIEISLEEYRKINLLEKVKLLSSVRTPLKRTMGETVVPEKIAGYSVRNASIGSYGSAKIEGDSVELEEHSVHEIFKIKLQTTGQEIDIEAKYLNN